MSSDKEILQYWLYSIGYKTSISTGIWSYQFLIALKLIQVWDAGLIC